MSESKKNTTTNNYGVLWVAGLIFFISLVAVSIHFLGAELPNCNEANEPVECKALYWAEYRASWGQFGDFMGGMVNPFIGLLTIYLLVTTIAQQGRALDQTENALDHANKALEQNETAIKQAYEALKQNAEALAITREEIIVARAEIQLSRDINKKTEAALTEQIKISRSQNNFSNFYKHLEEFSKYISTYTFSLSSDVPEIDLRRLHFTLYPNAKLDDGNNFDINTDVIISLIKPLYHFFCSVKSFSDSGGKSYIELTEAYDLFHEDVQIAFGESVVLPGVDRVTIVENGETHYVAFQMRHIFNRVYTCFELIDRIVRFEPQLTDYDYVYDLLSALKRFEINLGEFRFRGDKYIEPGALVNTDLAGKIADYWIEILAEKTDKSRLL